MLGESGLTAHFYLFLGGVAVMAILVIYAFVVDHKHSLSKEWVSSFTSIGVSADKVENISHDEEMWYYAGKSTCVGYGDYKDSCPKFQGVCAGEKGKTFGSALEQARAVKAALDGGGSHSQCPLIY